MDPIFIIGTERSGTNLLRLILNSHSNIAVPHPPHILKNFFELEPLYGDLSEARNFRRLVNDVVRLVELHSYPWEMRIDRDKVVSEARERDLVNVYFAVYDQYRQKAGKKRWGCKSTFMINHVALVRHYYPDAKFIYMVRDGRDVAVSAKDVIFNRYSVYYIAKLWREEQLTGMYWLNKLPRQNMLLLKYEELLSVPEGAVRNLCSFLGESYEGQMLDFFNTSEAKKSSSLSRAWRNTSGPIMRNNIGKYKAALTPSEIALFEAIAGRELDYFAYKLENPAHILEGMRGRGIKFRMKYLWEEMFLMLRAQLKSLFTDRNIFLRCRKYLFLKSVRISRRIRWQ